MIIAPMLFGLVVFWGIVLTVFLIEIGNPFRRKSTTNEVQEVTEDICDHDWIVARSTEYDIYSSKASKSHQCINFRNIDGMAKNAEVAEYLGVSPAAFGSAFLSNQAIPVDGYYQDAVCSKCDTTDLSFAKMLPELKAKRERNKQLLEDLKTTIRDLGDMA